MPINPSFLLELGSNKNVILFLLLVLILSSCGVTKIPPIKDGGTAYTYKKYALATELLQKEVAQEKDVNLKWEKSKLLAESYLYMGDYANSLKVFQSINELRFDKNTMEQQALLQKTQDDYTGAIKTFQELLKEYPGKDLYKNEIEICKEAVQQKKENTNYKIRPLADLNTAGSDFSIAPIGDEKYVFSSNGREVKGAELNAWTGSKNGDLFLVQLRKEVALVASSLSDSINTPFYEATSTFTRAGNEIYFTRCEEQPFKHTYCKIFHSKNVNNVWQTPEEIKLFDDTTNVGHPWLSNDGKRLFFSSDFKKGFGGKDIYYTEKEGLGWGEPINVGMLVNTAGDEVFPTVDGNGMLYFSSNKHLGYGGLDIFSSTWNAKEAAYGNVKHLPYPLNTSGDDLGIIYTKQTPKSKADTVLQSGYLSSTRSGGKGKDDLYFFEKIQKNTIILTVYVKTLQDSSNALILLDSSIVELTSSKNTIKKKATVGTAKYKLEPENEYKITASKTGYFTKSTTLSSANMVDATKDTLFIETTLVLEKIQTNKDIVIPNIYYDYDKATLRPESLPVLDTLVEFFKENSTLNIEIGSHTDSRGSDSYNQKLSQARAQSVVDYLISKGVKSEDITAKGYGESKPVNNCTNGVKCTEEEHQRNRRTTFKVIGMDKVLTSE